MARKITKKERKLFSRSQMPADNFERLAKMAAMKAAFYDSTGVK